MKVGSRKLLALSALMLLVGCTNDYADFDMVGSAGTDVVPHDGADDKSTTGAGGSHGSESEDGGEESSDAASDVSQGTADAEASVDGPIDAPAEGAADAPNDAPVDGSVDARLDSPVEAPIDSPVDAPIDAPADVASDVIDAAAEARADASESGTDSGAEAEASTGVDAAAETSPPADASDDYDGAAASDVTDAQEAEAAPSCEAGTKLCGVDCVSVTDPATGCAGPSCAPCSLPHAAATCAPTGECAVVGCAAGYDDCDGQPANGCESLLASDVANCGACGRACAGDSVLSKQCTGGLCVSTCALGHSNCAYPYSAVDDGCEVPSSNTQCGSCGNDCTKQGSGLTCGAAVANVCGCAADLDCRVMGSMGTCDTGTGRCTCDMTLCAPGEACRKVSGPDVCSCNGGTACTAAQTCCQWPAGCRNLKTDPSSCGACGRSCPSGFFCSAGECACAGDLECNAGSPGTCAAGQCVCGGVTCPKGQRCQPGGGCG